MKTKLELILFHLLTHLALGEIHEYLEGDWDDFDVGNRSVAALDQVGQNPDRSAVVAGHLDAAVRRVVRGHLWKGLNWILRNY